MKKKTLLLTLASATLLLSSCGKISAQFPNGDSPLTNANANLNLDHNTLSVIYDSIKNSDTYESDVSSILTDALAKEVIGDFEITAGEGNDFNVVLKGYDGENEATQNEFINSHPAYNNWEVSGYRLTLSENAPSKEEFKARLQSVKNIIKNQIISSLWSEANATDYKRNNRFYEVLYARNIYEQLYEVNIPEQELSSDVPDDDDPLHSALYTNPNYESHYNYFDEEENGKTLFIGFKDEIPLKNGLTDGALIDGSYNTNTEEGRTNICNVLHFNYYIDYINNAILPGIIENLLVEQYIFEQQYTAIGNTQSRRINYITIADNTEKNASAFLTSFIENYIIGSNKDNVNEDNVNKDNVKLPTNQKWDFISDAWKGFASEIDKSTYSTNLANATFGNHTTKNPSAGLDGHVSVENDNGYNSYFQTYATDEANQKYFTYYENTEYADLVEQYSTLTNNPTTNNSTNYTNFTTIDSHDYDPVVGFTIKADEILVEDFTTEGWQTRDDSSLPDAAKNKLYSFGLVNEWRPFSTTNGDYRGTYIYRSSISGRSYLRKDAYTSTEDSLLWRDGDNYYIIEVDDIITPSNISFTENSDETPEVKAEKENKARVIGYTLASGDTYRTNAITYYLEQSNINYHDQDVYDYFNTTYPDLFD